MDNYDERVKAYFELTNKVFEIKKLIEEIRKKYKKYDKETQNAVEMSLYKFEKHLNYIDSNSLVYWGSKEKANWEYIALTLEEGILVLIKHDLVMGHYNKKVKDSEYSEFIESQKNK